MNIVRLLLRAFGAVAGLPSAIEHLDFLQGRVRHFPRFVEVRDVEMEFCLVCVVIIKAGLRVE